MSRSICQGPFFLFLPLLLGAGLTYMVATLLRPVIGTLAWHWFVVLFGLCFLLCLFIVRLWGHLCNRRNSRR